MDILIDIEKEKISLKYLYIGSFTCKNINCLNKNTVTDKELTDYVKRCVDNGISMYVTKLFTTANKYEDICYKNAFDAIVLTIHNIYFKTYGYEQRVLNDEELNVYFNLCDISDKNQELINKLRFMLKDKDANVLDKYVEIPVGYVPYKLEKQKEPEKTFEECVVKEKYIPTTGFEMLGEVIGYDKQRFESSIHEWFGKETGIW